MASIHDRQFSSPEEAREWMADWYSRPEAERDTIVLREGTIMRSGDTAELPYCPKDPEFAPGPYVASTTPPITSGAVQLDKLIDIMIAERFLFMAVLMFLVSVAGGMLGGAIIWYAASR